MLVNNAGYGYQAAVEEGEDAEIRAQFDANVFGLFAMTRAVLPGMRARRSGHVISITSVAGFCRVSGVGLLRGEQARGRGLGGCSGRRGRAARDQGHLHRAGAVPYGLGRALAAADAEPDRRLRRHGRGALEEHGRDQRQSGRRPSPRRRGDDPHHRDRSPPRHLVLGAWGLDAVTNKLKATLAEIEEWRETGLATDFPKN